MKFELPYVFWSLIFLNGGSAGPELWQRFYIETP